MKYKYTLDNNETRLIETLKGVYFTSEWLTIKDGLCTIKEGYSWDGATPKIKIFGKWIGTSDGKNDELKYPTLWHDVFTQYGIGNKKDVDRLFLSDMLKVDWKFPILYYRAVRLLGWLRWKRN